MKKICVLAACLVLVASLAVPAFAKSVSPSISDPALPLSYNVTLDDYSAYEFHLDTAVSSWEFTVTTDSSSSATSKLTFDHGAEFYSPYGSYTVTSSQYPDATVIYLARYNNGIFKGKAILSYTYPFSVDPAMPSPIVSGEYVVSDQIGTQSDAFMYTEKFDPKIFVFSDVTANASTVVSYAIAGENSAVTYHDIGTLTDGFTFNSADYPVASYFAVRNSGSSLVSYTVSVSNASFEKSETIAKSIWETCLTMGTAMITWLTTGTNFIVLIPIAMMLLVFAVLCIRKLIKGV